MLKKESKMQIPIFAFTEIINFEINIHMIQKIKPNIYD
jgi:hypothetical protein